MKMLGVRAAVIVGVTMAAIGAVLPWETVYAGGPNSGVAPRTYNGVAHGWGVAVIVAAIASAATAFAARSSRGWVLTTGAVAVLAASAGLGMYRVSSSGIDRKRWAWELGFHIIQSTGELGLAIVLVGATVAGAAAVMGLVLLRSRVTAPSPTGSPAD